MAARRVRVLSVLLLAAMLGFAGSAAAYVIILKSGGRLIARAKPTVQGENYVYQDKLGTWQQVRTTEVDAEKTEKENALGLRDAYVLGKTGAEETTQPPPQPQAPSLSDYIRRNRKTDLEAPPIPTPAPHEVGFRAPAEAGAAPPTIDPAVNEAFLRAMETAGVRGVRLAPGPGGLIRVQAITDTETAVFAAIGASARGMKEARAAGQKVEKVQLYLATANGSPAGKFELSPDDADALLNGTISAAKYFVANVIF